MNIIFKTAICIWLGVFFLCYLLGSFASASFNVGTWGESSRAFVAFVGGIVSSAVTAAYLDHNKNQL